VLTPPTASLEIEKLAASVSKDGAELKDATAIREKEAAEFATSEADLEATIDTLSCAIGVIEKVESAFCPDGRLYAKHV